MQSGIKIIGRVHLELFGPDGALKDERRVENMIVNTGRAAIIDRLQGATPAVFDYIGIGTDSTVAAAAQTALIAQTARTQGTLSQPDAYTDRCVYTFAAGAGTGTITEAARFNDPTAGTMIARTVFTGITKAGTDSLQITYDLTYAAS